MPKTLKAAVFVAAFTSLAGCLSQNAKTLKRNPSSVESPETASNSQSSKKTVDQLELTKQAVAEDAGVCSVEVVGDLVRTCCGKPYTAYYNCTNFANNFHDLCEKAKLPCKTMNAACEEMNWGHAFNLVRIGTSWCLVEPQGFIPLQCGIEDPNNIPTENLCKFFHAGWPSEVPETGCKCGALKVSATPLNPNADPSVCIAKRGTTNEQCTACCLDNIKFFDENDIPLKEQWKNQCLLQCGNLPLGSR